MTSLADVHSDIHQTVTAAVLAALAAQKARPGGFDPTSWDGDIDSEVADTVDTTMGLARAAALAVIGGGVLADGLAPGWETLVLDAVRQLGLNLYQRLGVPGVDPGAVWAAAEGLAGNIGSLAAQGLNAALSDAGQAAGLAAGATVPALSTWNAVGDQATRPDHADADGQTVDFGTPFQVGAEDLMYPGDPEGSFDNIAGCRCWLTFQDVSGNDMGDEFDLGDG